MARCARASTGAQRARSQGMCASHTPAAGRGRPVDVDGDSRPAGNAADVGVCAKGRPAISAAATARRRPA